MTLSDEHRPLLLAVLEALVPVEPTPAPLHEELLRKIETRLDDPALSTFAQTLPRWLEALNTEALTVFSSDLQSLFPSSRDELFDRIECDNFRTDWQLDIDPHQYFDQLVNLIADIHLGPEERR